MAFINLINATSTLILAKVYIKFKLLLDNGLRIIDKLMHAVVLVLRFLSID